MLNQRPYARRVARLEHLMSSVLGLKHGGLTLRAKRARRQLPRAIKRDLQEVAQAAHLSGNPRIAPTIDQARVEAAFRRAQDHLQGPVPREARKTRAIGLAAGLAFNLLLVFGAFVGLVVWAGLI